MPTTLAGTAELAAHPEWRVFDCRHDLARPGLGEEQYREAHIPGALFAHLDRDLSAPKTGRNGRHPLPQPEAFTSWLARCGVNPSDQIVCYDAANGAMAARLWWMLRWIGHERSEEHTSELQSRPHLVCRLLLEKKKKKKRSNNNKNKKKNNKNE